MQIHALANQKGGCGKTTTAIHLAAALHCREQRVLLIDLDPQAHATLGLGCFVGPAPSALEVLVGECGLREASREVRPGFDVLPATLGLGEFEEAAVHALEPEQALHKALERSGVSYDHVLVDCPPRADGVLTANALRAATDVMLVVETGAFALQGALRAAEIFDLLLAEQDHAPRRRVLATMFDRRTRFAREVLVAMQARFGAAMFDTAIRQSVRLREAVASGQPAVFTAPRSFAARDHLALADEVLASAATLVPFLGS